MNVLRSIFEHNAWANEQLLELTKLGIEPPAIDGWTHGGFPG